MNALDLGKNGGVKLKPCPFCGSTGQHILKPTCTGDDPYRAGDRAFPIVKCAGCFAEAHGDNWDQTTRSAVKAWNTRHEDQPSEFDRLCKAENNHV